MMGDMTFPGNFLRMQVSGSLYGTESWSWTLSLVPDFPGPGEDAPSAVPPAVASAVQNFHIATSGPAARLKTLKLNELGPDGRYTSASETVLYDWDAPGIVGSSGSPYPAQIALAVSLVTGVRRGLARNGRFYIPAPVGDVETNTGGIASSRAQAVAAAATTMLNGINAAVPGYRVGVASNVGSGAFEVVQNVRVGKILDTIRSRRTSLLEAYSVGAPLAP